MKSLLLIISFFIFQTGIEQTLSDISTAMGAGSSKEIVKRCNKTVEIKLNGKSANYSKTQAEVILKDFFMKNPAKSFNYIHQGSSPEGLKYTIGRYTTESGSFRIVMFIKEIDANYLIDTLSFSKE